MKTFCSSAVAVFLIAAPAIAQVTKTIPGETRVVSTTVEAIDHQRRVVTAKKADGTYEDFYFPSTVKRFDTLKVGDKISARYYENIVLQLKPPGSPAMDSSSGAVTRAESGMAGTAAHQRTITATITAIDPALPSITFSGPNNWKYSTRVKDKEALAKVKVGDRVDITWTEAMILSLDESK